MYICECEVPAQWFLLEVEADEIEELDEIKAVKGVANDLWRQWQRSLKRMLANDTEENVILEQRAHDELVDYIEAHEMNGSEYDPR